MSAADGAATVVVVDTDVVIELVVRMDGDVVSLRPSSRAGPEAHAALIDVATVTMSTAAVRAAGATT